MTELKKETGLAQDQPQIQESEEIFQSLVENAPDAIYILVGNRITYVNQAMVHLMGAGAADQLLGISIYDRIHPSFHEKIQQRIHRVIDECKPVGLMETVYLRMDGSPIETESSVAPFRFNNSPAGFVILRDISKRKEAEKLLRESEAKIRAMYESSYDAIVLMNEKGFLDCNPRTLQIFNTKSKEEFVKTHPAELSPPTQPDGRSSWDTALEHIHAAFRNGIDRFEYVHRRKNGEDFPAEVLLSAFDYGKERVLQATIRDITDRKRAEEALKESEERYRLLVENSPDAVILHTGGRIVYVNPAGFRMFGVKSSEDVAGHTVLDFVHPDFREIVSQRFRVLYDKRELVDFMEEKFLRLDGRPIDVEVAAMPVIFHGLPSVQVVFRDITERKRAEEALQQSEKKYRELVENANSIILKWDKNGSITFFNEFAQQFFGYTNDEIIGKPVIGTIVPASESGSDRDLQLLIEEIIRHPDDYIFNENENITRAGKRVWIRWQNKPLLDENGQFAGLLSIGTDNTERRRAELALQQSEAEYRTLFENSGSPLMIFDEDTTILLVNRELEKQVGYAGEEIVGRMSWTEFIADTGTLEMMKEYHRLRMVNPDLAPLAYESRIITRTGEIRNVIITVAMIPATKQSVAATVDITERKKAEEDLQKLYNELEQRVIDRTADLRQAQEAYRKANEKLNLLSSITRHDILNQLTALRGYLELSVIKTNDDAVGEYIRKAERAAATIERHISFTKLYQDIGVTSPAWQNVRGCLEKPAADLLPASVTLVADLDAVEIYADPLFEKVIYTLIDNTLRHGEKVTRIRLSFRQIDTGGLVLLYEDNGVGIAAEDKERIFERGFGKHTGFGLFIAREILSITGITIRETGEPGKGVRFEIAVPDGSFRI